jgi:hypothetical protein
VTTKKAPVRPLALAKEICMAKVRLGMWWYGEYDDGHLWARVDAILTLKNDRTGQVLLELRGPASDGVGASHREHRDTLVQTLTAAQARQCGLGS